MKTLRRGRRLTAVLLILTLIFAVSLGNTALAANQLINHESTVTIIETDEGLRYTFDGEDNNLFENFAGVMPGDKLSQTITVRADDGNRESYRVYLYARVCGYVPDTLPGETEPVETEPAETEPVATEPGEPAETEPVETEPVETEPVVNEHPGVIATPGFLDQLTITVTQGEKELGGVDIGTGTGAEGVPLGEFGPGQSTELNVDLLVDINMGNEFQYASAYIDWVFYAEPIPDSPILPPDTPPTPSGDPTPTPPDEDIDDDDVPTTDQPDEDLPDEDIDDGDVPLDDLPDDPTDEEIEDGGVPMGDMPETGDSSPLLLWMALTVLSGAGIVVLLLWDRRKARR